MDNPINIPKLKKFKSYAYKAGPRFVVNFYSLGKPGEFVVLSEEPKPSQAELDEAYQKYSEDISAKLEETRLKTLRTRRDELLSACDWTQTQDAPLSDEAKLAWKEYRQALRDLPESNSPIWPTPPKP